MQNMQNISPLFFSLKDQKTKTSESESSMNSRTCLGHLILFIIIYNNKILVANISNFSTYVLEIVANNRISFNDIKILQYLL